jgi:hypothetical protein
MKIYSFSIILFSLFFLIPVRILSQDIIYKNDSTILKVIIKDSSGNTIIFQSFGDTTGTIYYLSKSVLDSIKYEDGKSIHFPYSSVLKEPEPKLVNRNYLNVELVGTLAGQLNLDYESIFKNGRAGIVAGFLINTKPNDYDVFENGFNLFPEYLTYRPFYYFVRGGVIFYPFNHSLVKYSNFRLSTGLSALLCSYRQYGKYDGFSSDPLRTFGTFFMGNVRGRLYLGDHLQIIGGIEISILPPIKLFCPQLGISIGF